MLNWRQNTKNIRVELLLRGDVVKDDSGSYAVFTEQGFQADAVSAYTQVKMEDAHKLFLKKFPNRSV